MEERSELLDLDQVRIEADLALCIPPPLALRRRVLPFGQDGDVVYAACEDPQDHAAVEAVERISGKRVIAIAAEHESLERALNRVFGGPADRKSGAEDDGAVGMIEDVLRAAIVEQASDVHLDPQRTDVQIRFRIDGDLVLHRSLAPDRLSALVNRVKVLSDMDIAERRVPQDGSFTWTYGRPGAERRVDVRVAVLPTRHGERVTMRLLGSGREQLDLRRLGMGERELGIFRRALGGTSGMVLITGPTGSGKSTTLHAGLRELDRARRHLVTIEDPIELDLPGASQVEVGGELVRFSDALRSSLRHDPDVIMVGEIRDMETAEVATRAALTGHLVLSTLHTSTAIGSVTRLVDMGMPRYLVAATLRLAIAQRLVRRLCARCKVERPLTEVEAGALGVPERAGAPVAAKRGCVFCRRTGFTGRIGLFALAPFGDELATAVAGEADEVHLANLAAESGGSTLREDALAKVLGGEVRPEEVLAVLGCS